LIAENYWLIAIDQV